MRESVLIGTGACLVMAVLSGTVFYWVLYFVLVYVWPKTSFFGCLD